MCQWGANGNPWLGYQIGLSSTPHVLPNSSNWSSKSPRLKLQPNSWRSTKMSIERSSSDPITVVVITLLYTTVVTTMHDDCTYFARSAFAHLGLWQKLYDCSLHHFTTSQCILKCAPLTLSSTSNWLAEIWKGNFSTPGLVDKGGNIGDRGWADLIARPWVPSSSTLTLISYHFWVI